MAAQKREEEEGRRDWTREIKEKAIGRTSFSSSLRECVWLPTLPVCNLNLQPPPPRLLLSRRKVEKASIQIFLSSWLGQLGGRWIWVSPCLRPCSVYVYMRIRGQPCVRACQKNSVLVVFARIFPPPPPSKILVFF